MPQIGFAFAALGGAISTVGAGVGGVLAGTALGGGIGGTILGAFGKIAIGVALSAASRALLPKPEAQSVQGTRTQIQTGETVPLSFIMGRAATAGDLVYLGDWDDDDDTPHEHNVIVIELSDIPAKLERVWVNGEWATLGTTLDPAGRGYPVEGYEDDGFSRLHIKYYDGTQTVADPYLVAKFGTHPDRPWTSDMIGRGIAYAIVTMGFRPEVHRSRPKCLFELSSYGHYDRREDDTQGGAGAQRANNRNTWTPSHNAAVIAENILRGIKDPITGAFIWGGQGISHRELPTSSWFAAANECDVQIETSSGDEDQYRCGMEIRVDTEPAEAIEAALAACSGNIAEVAGEWLIRCGPPGPSVFAFTDEDVIVTAPDTFDPFPGLDEAYNGVTAQYPEPSEGWEPKDAPDRRSADYLADDGGRRNEANILYGSVPYRRQVQRLMRAALEDSRRFRIHNLLLPPEARKLAPLDTVSWTSQRNGYSNKQFEVQMVEDQPNGMVALALREVDPNDYSWNQDLELPTVINEPVRPPRVIKVSAFSVEEYWVEDTAGNQRRCAIKLNVGWESGTDGVRYQVRLASNQSHVPVDGSSPRGIQSFVVISGEGLLPLETYEVRARLEPIQNRAWSGWMSVTMLDLKMGDLDIAQSIKDQIDALEDIANQAGADAVAALDKANEVEATVDALNQDVLDQLQAITDELAGIDTGSIQEFRGIAIAGLRKGWIRNPKFSEWTSGLPDNWTASNGHLFSKSPDGFWGSAALFQSISTDPFAQLQASSATAGEMPAADPNAEYVVVEALLFIPSGTITGNQYCRVEWKNASNQLWTRGDAFGSTNVFGLLGTQWGFGVSATNSQSKSIIFKKPSITADAIRLLFRARNGTDPAITIRIDNLDVRAATEAEVKAYLANGYADAAIDTLEQTIVGPTGAIASQANILRAEFGAADAVVQTNVNTVSTDLQSLAGRVTSVEATYGGNNNAKNPDFFDGARPAGQNPTFWIVWQSAFSVVARGSSGANAVVNAPTSFIGISDAGTNAVIATPHDFVPITKNARVSVGYELAGIGSGINVQMQALIDWYDADKVLMTSSGNNVSVTNTGWASPDWGSFEAPTGASYYKMRIRRVPGGSANQIVFTNVYSRIVDAKSYARAEEAAVAAADANSAIAQWKTKVEASYNGYDNFLATTVSTASASSTNTQTLASWNTSVEAKFNNFNAFVTAGQTAVTTADLAASTYVVRATAGGGSAGLRVVAFDDETGSGGSVTLFGDNVIAPGTLSTQSLVITDLGMNKVPDDQIQSDRVWGGAGVGYQIINPTPRADVGSIGELRWNFSSGGGIVEADGGDFIVREGMRLHCTFEMVANGNAFAGAQLRYADKSGAFVGTQTIEMISASNTATKKGSAVLVVPTGASRARFRFRVDKSQTNNSVRFYAPKVIEQTDGTILITPNSITGAQLVATDVLIANEAQIGNLVVGTSNIKNNAVTDAYFSYNDSELSIGGDDIDNWTTMISVAITRSGSQPVEVVGVCDIQLDANLGNRTMESRIIRVNSDNSTSSVVSGVTGTAIFASRTTHIIRGFDTNGWSGTRTFRLQIRMITTPYDRVNVTNRYITGGQIVVAKK